MAKKSRPNAQDRYQGELRITPAYPPQQREKRPPCQGGCPNGGDIRGWIGTVAQRDRTGMSRHQAYARAWSLIADVNPFAAVLGRICPHPCESHCSRAEVDAPVSINALERFLGDWAIEHELALPRLTEERYPEWIGVVGAGPSGLSFAYQMARRGYRVRVYERHPEAGGMLRYGIPDYRLPRAVLDAEIRRIVDLGVELLTDVAVGRDLTVSELRRLHPVLYLGIGAQHGLRLGIEGEDGPGVLAGIEYLRRVNRGDTVALGRCVVVVGGGNTAVDAARTARRSGAEVVLLYRRSRAEMPAEASEVDEAEEEGVRLEPLAAPTALVREDGKLRAVRVQRMRLGEPDRSGRKRPVPIAGAELELSADTLITAISQQPDWDELAEVAGSGAWLTADAHGQTEGGLWAGGDVLGPGIAGLAIAQGRRAAENVHARLRGLALPVDPRPPIDVGRIKPEAYSESRRSDPERLPSERALDSPHAEVHLGLDEERFLNEIERCFSCGACMGCQRCAMYCTAGCYVPIEEAEPGLYYTLDLDSCLECGKCVEVCPCGYLEAIPPS